MSEVQSQHVFVSYVHQDSEAIDNLCKILTASEIPYWRDRDSLFPGDAWKAEIRRAIQGGSLVFLACFSVASRDRDKSYMNEELSLAVDEFRKMPPGRTWLIPVRLDDVEIPEWDLGAGRMLSDVHSVDLFGDGYALQAASLVTSITKSLSKSAPAVANLQEVVATSLASERAPLLRRLTKEMLPVESRRIELDDLIGREVRSVLDAMSDITAFPVSLSSLPEREADAAVAATAQKYFDLLVPFCYSLQVACRWGTANQLRPWADGLQALASAVTRPQSGTVALSEVRQVAVLAPMVTAALASVGNENWAAIKAMLLDKSVRDQRGRDFVRSVIEVTNFWAPFGRAEVAVNALARAQVESVSIEDAVEYFSVRGGGRLLSPAADWLHSALRPVFEEQYSDDEQFSNDYDLAEVVLGCVSQDVATTRYGANPDMKWLARSHWFGRSTWRAKHGYGSRIDDLREGATREGIDWAPVQSGLFGGSSLRALAAINAYHEAFTEVSRQQF